MHPCVDVWIGVYLVTEEHQPEIVELCCHSRFLMKLFRSFNTEVIAECQRYFGFSLSSERIEKIQINLYIITIIF